MNSIEFITQLKDGRNVIYENDYGANRGRGYALLYRDNEEGYERYEIGHSVKDGKAIQFPDLGKPLNYSNGTNRI